MHDLDPHNFRPRTERREKLRCWLLPFKTLGFTLRHHRASRRFEPSPSQDLQSRGQGAQSSLGPGTSLTSQPTWLAATVSFCTALLMKEWLEQCFLCGRKHSLRSCSLSPKFPKPHEPSKKEPEPLALSGRGKSLPMEFDICKPLTNLLSFSRRQCPLQHLYMSSALLLGMDCDCMSP